MSFLHSLLSLPREGLAISAAVLAGLMIFVWFLTLFATRQRYVTIKRSEETELLAFHIRRIADALDRLSAERASHPPADAVPEKRVGLSTYGH
jgi:hypothetical protein